MQGSYAEYIKLPESNVMKLADTISQYEGALVEPSTVALHALELVSFRGGEDVAIIGGGTIGLLTCEWAKIFRAGRVFVFDLDSEMLELSKKFGADVILNANDTNLFDNGNGKNKSEGFCVCFRYSWR
jgi:L-iditol 2-dehydrogenase